MAGTAGHTLGHNKMDQRFFDEYGDQLVPLDHPEELPYAARLVFTGDEREAGSLFVRPSPERQCTGTAWVRDSHGDYVMKRDADGVLSRMQRPCGNWRMLGAVVCHKHGGSAPLVKEAAQIRLLCAADAVSGELISIAMDRSQDGKVRVMAINSLLDRVGIKTGLDINIEPKGFETLLKKWMDNGLEDAAEAANSGS